MMEALARHLVESTVFAAIVSLLPFFMKKRSAASRHTVWLIAASKFAVPAALFSAIGSELRALFHAFPLSVIVSPALSSLLSRSNTHASSAGGIGYASAPLAVVWVAGAILMLTFWLRELLTAFDAPAPVLDSEDRALSEMKHRIGFNRAVRLRSSKSKMEPGLSGILHPTVTIPEGLSAQLTRAEFEAILLHELAHAQRGDNLTGTLVHALVCVFWFHPLLWWIERRLAAEREHACDEMVVRHSRAPEEYVSGILKVCRFHFSGSPAGVCGIVGPNLENRMEAIMSCQSSNLPPRTPKLLVGALACVMTIFPLAGGFLGKSALYAQANKENHSSVTCTFDGKDYEEGQVILEEGTDHQQMCVGSNGKGTWIRTNDAARQRAQTVIKLSSTKPLLPCQPQPSPSAKLCACQTGIFSIGAIVDSANGPLRCDKGKWRPATRAELGLK